MFKEKEFDCVKFKDTLFAESWKKSEAKNFREYVEYVNARARKSDLYKKQSESPAREPFNYTEWKKNNLYDGVAAEERSQEAMEVCERG